MLMYKLWVYETATIHSTAKKEFEKVGINS